MMNTGGNKIDELFKKSLEEEEVQFDEAHWRDMRKKLEQDGKRTRDIFFWTSLGGVAAMFLMTMGWWFTQSVYVEPTAIAKNNSKIKEALKDPAATVQIPQAKELVQRQDFNKKHDYINTALPDVKITQQENIETNKVTSEDAPGITEKSSQVLAENIPEVNNNNASPEQKSVIALQDNHVSDKTDSAARIVTTKAPDFKPSVILSITAAPDLSAVNSFSNVKLGSSAGLLATVNLSRKFGITTGVQLARKIYRTGFSNYKPDNHYVFPITPATIDADCQVLDIPLNLNYVLFNKGKNKIQLSAGASSYLMLDEKYAFSYENPMKYPGHYEVKNQNRHFMGIGNLAVSYEKKLSKNAGVAIQPFVKLPLTEIGYGNVKLMSAGFSTNLNFNVSGITGKKR